MSRQSAREKILDTAGPLFYEHGFRAIGVDTIVEKSGVAKMSLYRHFPSKDDLIAAYLQTSHDLSVVWMNELIAPYPDDPRAAIHALFEGIAEQARQPVCYGCTFVVAASEFPEHDHPAHQLALAYKQTMLDLLLKLTTQAEASDPLQLAQQLFLLMDGAWAAVRVFGTINPSQSLVSAVRVLLEASLPQG
jgi:AcrR family transcriptional regulator